jgi:hypothetical protein
MTDACCACLCFIPMIASQSTERQDRALSADVTQNNSCAQQGSFPRSRARTPDGLGCPGATTWTWSCRGILRPLTEAEMVAIFGNEIVERRQAALGYEPDGDQDRASRLYAEAAVLRRVRGAFTEYAEINKRVSELQDAISHVLGSNSRAFTCTVRLSAVTYRGHQRYRPAGHRRVRYQRARPLPATTHAC